jgi:hypothetical protein
MAKPKSSKGETRTFLSKPKTKRPGVHSKKKTSKSKNSKNYKKAYRGQGK